MRAISFKRQQTQIRERKKTKKPISQRRRARRTILKPQEKLFQRKIDEEIQVQIFFEKWSIPRVLYMLLLHTRIQR